MTATATRTVKKQSVYLCKTTTLHVHHAFLYISLPVPCIPVSCPLFFYFLPWGSEWGYLDNTKHFIFWLCNMKQLNFRHFNTNSKKFFETVSYFPERNRNGSKKANIILFSISRSFWPFYDNAGLFHKISEGYWRFPKTVEEFRRLTKRSDHCRRCPKNPSNT